MNIEFTRSFLLWCTVLNYGILLVWFLGFAIAHDLDAPVPRPMVSAI